MRQYHFELFADYFQFYLIDPQAEFDFSRAWNPETHAQMLAVIPGGLAVGTARNMSVPVSVEIHDAAPALAAGYDRVNHTHLRVSSGQLAILGCSEYYPDAARLELAPGSYNVRVYYWNLDSLSPDGFDGDDYYQVVLWPDSPADPPAA